MFGISIHMVCLIGLIPEHSRENGLWDMGDAAGEVILAGSNNVVVAVLHDAGCENHIFQIAQ